MIRCLAASVVSGRRAAAVVFAIPLISFAISTLSNVVPALLKYRMINF